MTQTADDLNDILVEMNTYVPPSRKRRVFDFAWKWTKRLCFCGFLIGTLTVICLTLWLNHRGEKAIEQIKAELAQNGITPKAIPYIPKEQDGTNLLKAAMLSVRPLPEEYENSAPIIAIWEWPKFGEGLTDEQAKHVQETAAINSTAYQLVDEVCHYDQFYFGITNTTDIHDFSDTTSQIRALCRWLYLKSLSRQSEGSYDQACEPLLQAFHILNGFRHETNTSIQLIRGSCVIALSMEIENLLGRGEISLDRLNQIQQQLINFDKQFLLRDLIENDMLQIVNASGNISSNILRQQTQIVESQKLQAKAMLDFVRSTGVEMDEIDMTYEPDVIDWCSDTLVRQFVYWCPGVLQSMAATEAGQMLKIRNQLKPIAFDAGAQKIDWSFLDQESNESGHPYVNKTIMGQKSHIRTMIVALACEKYRMQHGHWPTSLSDIYNPIPVDARGQEIRMIQRGKELRIYNIGEDGIDDNGLDHKEIHYDENASDTYDWRCRLLDPKNRSESPTFTKLQQDASPYTQSLKDYFERSLKGEIEN